MSVEADQGRSTGFQKSDILFGLYWSRTSALRVLTVVAMVSKARCMQRQTTVLRLFVCLAVLACFRTAPVFVDAPWCSVHPPKLGRVGLCAEGCCCFNHHTTFCRPDNCSHRSKTVLPEVAGSGQKVSADSATRPWTHHLLTSIALPTSPAGHQVSATTCTLPLQVFLKAEDKTNTDCSN